MHEIENALLSVDEVNGIAIVSNYDDFSKNFGRRKGFFGAGGFTLTCVLFSDYYQIRTICDGNVLETAYLFSSDGHGTRYEIRDKSATFEAFNVAGLEYGIPCGGLTEVLTTKIASKYKYSMGCMRGKGGKPCNNCMKCFRKSALKGQVISSNKEVEKKLSVSIIPMLPSLLWARDNKGVSFPTIDNISKDISWVDKWYPRSLELIPEYLHNHLLERLDFFNIEHMKDTGPLEKWVSIDDYAEKKGE
jgi:hypothetical protein